LDPAGDRALFAWQQHPGALLDLGTRLVDEAGRTVSLGSAFGHAPVILDLDYYHCPSLCGVVRSDLIDALANSGLRSGRDYRLVSLSIDPAETPADAAGAKRADLAQAPFADAASWHYWTGPAASIAAVAKSVGFVDRYDGALKQFLHPAGLVVLTREGRISGYLLGVGYSGGELRAAVLRAGSGGVAQAALPILLLCFHFDPSTGRYTLAILKLLKLLAGLTIALIGGLLLVLSRRGRTA
jgi:protein SCO1/2